MKSLTSLGRRIQFSVQQKLALGISLLVTIISVFIYWYFPVQMEAQSLEALKDKTVTVAEMMAYNLTPPLISNDRPTVCDVVISAKHIPEVDYIMVCDDSGRVIASHDSAKAMNLGYAEVAFGEQISSDGMTFQTVAPIIANSKLLGRVYVGVSLKRMLSSVEQTRRTIGFVCVGISLVGITFVILLSTLFTRPLIKIVLAAKKISEGDWKQRAPVYSTDEIGRLATAFNSMVDSLELAYKDLRQNEKNYRELFASNPHPMWVIDLETKAILDVNEAALESYGFSRNEFVAMNLNDIIVDGPADKMDQLQSRQVSLYRSTGWTHLKKDGTLIDVEMSSQPLPLSTGRKARIVLATDITSKLRAERLLRESEERYRELFESATDLILGVGADCRIDFVNRAWLQTLGYGVNEATGLHVFDLIAEDELARFKVIFCDVLNGKRCDGIQTVFVGKQGRRVIVEGSLNCKVSSKEVVSLRGIFRDVTERKRAEETILLEKARFEQLFENAPIGIVLADKEERILDANTIFSQMFGYSSNELAGRSLNDIVLPESLSTEGDSYSHRVLGGKTLHVETVRRRKDDSLINVLLYGVPIIVNGESLGLFGIYVDVTAKKQAEEKQNALMKELEAINRELNDFAYIVSHDLKAPLRAIGSLVNWITNDHGDKLGDEGNEMLKMLLGRTKRMHELIDGILKYSRIGRERGDPTPVPLDLLLPEIIDMIDPPSNVEIKIAPNLPIVMGEKPRVQQVFQNLLSNSVKFMDKPQGEINIGCERENGHWKFSVSDNGPGIEAKHYAKIFQIFQTLSSRDEFESTGIGLTIVKKIVEVYGGRVWVESEVGQGTTFYFTLPVSVN